MAIIRDTRANSQDRKISNRNCRRKYNNLTLAVWKGAQNDEILKRKYDKKQTCNLKK